MALRLSLGVVGHALPVDHDARFVTDDQRIMFGREGR
jgi:hypothetical protein